VRAALPELVEGLGRERGRALLEALIEDPDPKVRLTAIGALPRLTGRAGEAIVEALLGRATFAAGSADEKKATLEVYAQLAGSRSLNLLSRLVKDGEGLFAARDAEDLGVAAIRALAQVRARPVVDFLKRTCGVRSRRLREAAREVLVEMKEHA
jgi:HEAT repeat protein